MNSKDMKSIQMKTVFFNTVKIQLSYFLPLSSAQLSSTAVNQILNDENWGL